MLIPVDIVQAHDRGAIHLHDMDYLIQPMFNCCLVNIGDMLDNGTVINGKMVETPKIFSSCLYSYDTDNRTSCIRSVWRTEFKYCTFRKIFKKKLRKTFKTCKRNIKRRKRYENVATAMTQKELEAGIQTIQYQINTLMTTNGQSPFVTLFMYVEDGF